MTKLFTPINWQGVIAIAEYLIGGDTAIVNFGRLEPPLAVRAYDFVLGAAYALDLGGDFADRDGVRFHCFGEEAALGEWLNDRPCPSNILLFPGVRVG